MSLRQRQKAQETFLESFSENANVSLACKSANVHRSLIYQWLEHDEPFTLLYHQAELEANDAIRAEIHRRAIIGVEETVYQLGKKCGVTTKYSDVLLIFLAKSRMPEFREKGATTGAPLPKEYIGIGQDEDGCEP